MPLRLCAPNHSVLFQQLIQHPDRLVKLLDMAPLDDSRYLHWSELQRRTPPDGLSHEEWWFLLKRQRRAQRREVPLRQMNGELFWFAMTDEILQLSDEISRRAGGAVSDSGGALTPLGRDRYVVRSLMEESITSSQLEGATTSRRVATELLSSGRAPQGKSERMIVNNFLGMQRAKELTRVALSPAAILDLHEVLTRDTLVEREDEGRLETGAKERVSVWADNVCVHVPPPASELPRRLDQLCSFANGHSSDSPYIPDVVRATIVHFMFGYDHYFADGNGRTARTAFYWSMLRSGYWLSEFLTISKILREAPGQYGDSYERTEDDDGDLTYFVLHQLRVIRRALDALDTHLADKSREAGEMRQSLRGAADQFNFRQVQILESISRDGVDRLTAAGIATSYRVTTQTARSDLVHLENFGLLRRGRAKRPITWSPVPDFATRITRIGS